MTLTQGDKVKAFLTDEESTTVPDGHYWSVSITGPARETSFDNYIEVEFDGNTIIELEEVEDGEGTRTFHGEFIVHENTEVTCVAANNDILITGFQLEYDS